METKKRSIIKALSYRVLGLLVTGGVALLITRDMELALYVGGVDTIVKFFGYYAHERFWLRISYGRMKEPDYQI